MFKIRLNLLGGRGANSSEMGGGFTSANGESAKLNPMNPANLNSRNKSSRFRTADDAISTFSELTKNSEIEYGVSLDDKGFAHNMYKGNRMSVLVAENPNATHTIHNHPGNTQGSFSKADLTKFAKSKSETTSTVIDSGKRYSITKTKRFNSKAFTRAVGKAQWPKNLSYGDGADWWLKRNAKKYGYTYSRSKV